MDPEEYVNFLSKRQIIVPSSFIMYSNIHFKSLFP